MADVRLTAINPEDSSAVPVACNAKGELKLESAPWLEGNVSGDLTVVGYGSFANGQALIRSDGGAEFGNQAIQLNATGDAEFAGSVRSTYSRVAAHPDQTTGSLIRIDGAEDNIIALDYDGSAHFGGTVYSKNQLGLLSDSQVGALVAQNYSDKVVAYINCDGTAMFADGDISFKTGGAVDVSGNLAIGTGINNVRIFANGSATFTSDVVIGSRGKQWTIVESGGLAHLVEVTRVLPGNLVSTADLVDPNSQYPPLRDIPAELTMVEEQLQKVMERLKMAPEAGWEVWDGSD